MKKTIVYIVGRGHSGSTMLELLLNRNPHTAAMGEVNLLPLQLFRTGEKTRWTGECSCHERPLDCPEWGPALRKVEQRLSLDLTHRPLELRVSDEGYAEEYAWKRPLHTLGFHLRRKVRRYSQSGGPLAKGIGERYFKKWAATRDTIYEAYAEQRGVNCVVDASKDYLQMLDLYRYSKHDVRVLYITRDVRGHAWSSIRKKQSTAEKEAVTWSKLNGNILSCLEKVRKEHWLHVKYENLCLGLDSELTRIFDFVGIPNSVLDPSAEKQRRHTIAGNRTRFRDLDEIREDKKWSENLSPTDLQTLERIAGPVADKLGYVLTPN